MKTVYQLGVAVLSISMWLVGVSSALAGGHQKGELSKKWSEGKKCEDKSGKDGNAAAKCQEMAKQCSNHAVEGRKKAAELMEMANKTSGEESQIYRDLAKNFSLASDEKEKMATCVGNKDTAGYQKSQEAVEKIVKENGKLWEQLKKFKAPAEGREKSGDMAKAHEKQPASKNQGGSAAIESEADMKQWLNDDGSSKK